MLFSLLSPSTGLESLLLRTPRTPRFSVAGRLSYPTADHSSFLSSPNSPQLESDIGLQSPSSLSSLSNARVTYSDLFASSQNLDWPSTPMLGAGPRITVQSQGQAGKSSGEQYTSDSRKRLAGRSSFSQGRCASILQVLATPPSSNIVESVEICPIDIFSQTIGVGLGLGLTSPLSLPAIPRSTDEFTVIPITEVAPGSFSCSSSDSSSPQSTASAESSPILIPAPPSPPPIADLPRRFSTLNDLPLEMVVPTPAPAQVKYEGLGHGLPSHMRGSGTRLRLPSIPEEEVQPKASAGTSKVAQHTGLGLGLPSALRQAVQEASSSPSSSSSPPAPTSMKSRLQSTAHELFNTRKFVKRVLFPIPEARSREASAEGHVHATTEGIEKGMGKTAAAVDQQQQRQRQTSSRLQMSPAMLLAAQSILEEDKKFRKKEGLEKSQTTMSPTMRFASQAIQVQEEQRRNRKMELRQAGLVKKESKKFRFLF